MLATTKKVGGNIIEEWLEGTKGFWRLFSQFERILLVAFFTVFMMGLIGITRNNVLARSTVVAVEGGMFREGGTWATAAEREADARDLTHAGLLRLGDGGAPAPSLSTGYQISADGLHYSFALRNELKAPALEKQINDEKPWGAVRAHSEGEHTLVLDLKEPNSTFLSAVTEPLFPYGPYEVIKSDSAVFELRARSNPAGVKPYLKTIEFKSFATKDAVAEAFKKGLIDGAYDTAGTFSRANEFAMTNAVHAVLFFNTRAEQLKNKDVRAALAQQKPVANLEASLLVPDERLKTQAEALLEAWNKQDGKVELAMTDKKTFTEKFLPKHNYEMVLTTIDVGREGRLTPLWHSANTEVNLAQFMSREIDKILNDAFKTTDQAEKLRLYAQVDELIAQALPAVDFGPLTTRYVVSDRILGIHPTYVVNASDRFTNVVEWYSKTKRVRK